MVPNAPGQARMRKKIIYGEYYNLQAAPLFSVQADQRDKGYQDSDRMAAPPHLHHRNVPDKTLVFRHVTAKGGGTPQSGQRRDRR